MEKQRQIFMIPKEGSQFICLLVILSDSVFKACKSYYLQVFLEECKHVVKKRFLSILLMIQNFFDSDKENSDEENFDEKNPDEENYDEENYNEEN